MHVHIRTWNDTHMHLHAHITPRMHAHTHTHQFVLGQEFQQSDELDAIREVLVKVIDLHASLQWGVERKRLSSHQWPLAPGETPHTQSSSSSSSWQQKHAHIHTYVHCTLHTYHSSGIVYTILYEHACVHLHRLVQEEGCNTRRCPHCGLRHYNGELRCTRLRPLRCTIAIYWATWNAQHHYWHYNGELMWNEQTHTTTQLHTYIHMYVCMRVALHLSHTGWYRQWRPAYRTHTLY